MPVDIFATWQEPNESAELHGNDSSYHFGTHLLNGIPRNPSESLPLTPAVIKMVTWQLVGPRRIAATSRKKTAIKHEQTAAARTNRSNARSLEGSNPTFTLYCL